jgi:hypothetical protein
MNVQKELDDILEILQYRRKISMKVSSKVGEYRYGQIKSYNEAIELIKDLKNRWIEHEKNVASHEPSSEISFKKQDNLIQVV